MTNVQVVAALLDEHYGNRDWRNDVNPVLLDLENGRRCVLGQLVQGNEEYYDHPVYAKMWENAHNLHPNDIGSCTNSNIWREDWITELEAA